MSDRLRVGIVGAGRVGPVIGAALAGAGHAIVSITSGSDDDRVAELVIDAEAPFTQLSRQIVEQIDLLGPFGQGNPRPLMCASGAKLAMPPKRIGGGERHLAIQLEHHGVKIRGVAFGRGEWADELEATDGPLDIAYHPVINTFRGRSNVELQLVAWKPTEAKIPANQPG